MNLTTTWHRIPYSHCPHFGTLGRMGWLINLKNPMWCRVKTYKFRVRRPPCSCRNDQSSDCLDSSGTTCHGCRYTPRWRHHYPPRCGSKRRLPATAVDSRLLQPATSRFQNKYARLRRLTYINTCRTYVRLDAARFHEQRISSVYQYPISNIQYPAHLYGNVYMRVSVARALADLSDFGLFGKQSSQKCAIPCLGCWWTAVQNWRR